VKQVPRPFNKIVKLIVSGILDYNTVVHIQVVVEPKHIHRPIVDLSRFVWFVFVLLFNFVIILPPLIIVFSFIVTTLTPHWIEVVSVCAFLVDIIMVLLLKQVLWRVLAHMSISVRTFTVLAYIILPLFSQSSQLAVEIFDCMWVLFLLESHPSA
jgi:hypothetical protein